MEKFKIKAGFVFGQELIKLFDYCKENNCAIPAVNVTSSSTINGALSAASKANSPIIIQFSYNGILTLLAGLCPNIENLLKISCTSFLLIKAVKNLNFTQYAFSHYFVRQLK